MAPTIETKSLAFQFADVTVREREFAIVKAGQVQQVEPKAFRVLLILLRNPNKLISKEELLSWVWGDTAVTENSVARSIALLRRLLGDDPREPRFIETVSSIGYRFIATVEVIETTTGNLESPAIPNSPNPTINPNPEVDASSPSAMGRRSIAAASKRSKPTRGAFWPGLVGAVLALSLAWLLRPALPRPQVLGTTQLTHDGVPKTAPFVRIPIVTDGARVYFQELSAVVSPIMQVSAEGGETEALNVPLDNPDLAGISPNGHELLLFAEPNYVGRAGLWRMAVPGLQPRRIGNMFSGGAVAMSPDGSVIYYTGQNSDDILAADANGSYSRRLLTAPGHPGWFRISPDGHRLSFTVIHGESLDSGSLWQVNVDGTGLKQLLPGFENGTSLCCGDWTADGRYFIFQSIQGRISTLWALRDGGDLLHRVSPEPTQLTFGQMSTELPQPSKDGKRIFFFGTMHRGEIMRYDLKTHTLSPFMPGFSAAGISYTKDKQRMAYVSFPEGSLWQSRVDGTDRHQLTFSPEEVGSPHWSPDGSRIAFAGGLPGKPQQILLIPPEGGVAEQLTFGSEGVADPSWSPDGNSIAYSGPWSWHSTLPIHILNLKTRQTAVLPNSEGLFSVRWSPNGRDLLAITLPKGSLMMYDFKLRQWQPLVDTSDVEYPSWTPDSKCVYFQSSKLKGSPEFRVCLNDRKVQRVADMAGGGNLAWTAGGFWTGLAPDGSILELRDTSTEEIYALHVKLP